MFTPKLVRIIVSIINPELGIELAPIDANVAVIDKLQICGIVRTVPSICEIAIAATPSINAVPSMFTMQCVNF